MQRYTCIFAPKAKAQSTAAASQAEFSAKIRSATEAVAADVDGIVHGDAGTADLPFFLLKIEASDNSRHPLGVFL